MTTLITWKKRDDVIEIVKSLNGSSLLITGVSRTIKNKTEELKDEFLGFFWVN